MIALLNKHEYFAVPYISISISTFGDGTELRME